MGGIRPSFRVTREQGVDERGDGSARIREQRLQRGRVVVCATQAHGKAILSFERQAAAQQQEENAAERV